MKGAIPTKIKDWLHADDASIYAQFWVLRRLNTLWTILSNICRAFFCAMAPRKAGRHHHAFSQRTHLISRVGILPIQELCWKKPLLGGEAGIRSYHKQWCRFLGTIWRGKEGPSHVFARCLSYGVGRELDEQHNITTYYAVIKCVIKLTFTPRRSNFCQAAAALLCLSKRY
jgi:hypothetical protein